MMRTYHTLYRDASLKEDSSLQSYAKVYSSLKHRLLTAYQKTGDVNALKRDFLQKYGISSRCYNAILSEVKALIKSTHELRLTHIQELRLKIAALSKPSKKWRHKPETPQAAYGRQQRLQRVVTTLSQLEKDKSSNKVRVCFGGKKLFNAQHHLQANGYSSHSEWFTAWKAARESQFFVLGSKDENGGCQGATATLAEDGTFSLRIRLPQNEDTKYLVLRGLRFNYGGDVLSAALRRNQCPEESGGVAVSWRLQRVPKGWRVSFSTDLPEVAQVTSRSYGRVGVDLNVNHVAVVETDACGNVVNRAKIPLVTYGKSSDASKAAVGEAVKVLVDIARASGRPVVLETLDFQKKKATLAADGTSPRMARMLSSFAYTYFRALVESRAFDAGIEVLSVNPAYTSVIGKHNHLQRGRSQHQAAATAIARRSQRFSERPRRQLLQHLHPTCRDRGRHVWSLWAKIAKLKAPVAPASACESLKIHPSASPTLRVRHTESYLVDGVGESPTGESVVSTVRTTSSLRRKR